MPEPAALRSGEPRTIGPFRVRARLGSGGMGDVYLATGRRGRKVAVKLIRGAQLHDDEFRARFRREVRAVATVRSRHIANLVDADPEAELPWLATEYVAGPTLSQSVATDGPLAERDVLELVRGVAEALRAIHRADLVHRDVKPGNVILGPDGPRLIDLGVVATTDATRVTMTGQPVGTPMYMAPEQAAGSRATSAADVWALGALAYYAATGHHLYEGDHPAVVLYRVSAHDPSYDDAPAYLRPFLDACLVKDPEQRPSLDAILRSLGVPDQSALATLPVAGPGLLPYPRSGAPARRRPRRARAVLVSAVVATVVLGGAAAGLWDSLGDDPRGGGEQAATSGTNSGPGDTPEDPGASPEPKETTGASDGAPAADPDGSASSPWPQGSARRLGDDSCWIASVAAVQGPQAVLTISCDQAGTSSYGTPTPREWLDVYAVGQDGTVAQATAASATDWDTFWSQGHLTDPSTVTVTITLPDVGPLAAVEIRHGQGYGWHWAAGR
ncbi:serine/threonine-protein kinase [Promicromonospora thailandica]|uniref:Serine/threonine protein kinase n=1 Tax=Promicromonospora thailandica TaxID=765201 RepID=A0A9X2JU88_9MICO|nr:serine/threonine-protein kinase [Promicromonospora thailandica]MCP2263761.1 Serine/threonine protein kinase [Promicromonospora thailandica]